eukprot:Blabericola_migrator_1__12829@NODE_82_length_14933_cov_91_583546_g73_i0_p2_GENE_NODE_82_length_14933_cov_91_583546_g73_i0NODE_82_length_14933_cov_91_583546_g73_i0_p2_ORF_typecomplete_len1189_score208_02Glyco_transf_20/PF00982_21/1_8e118Trehalose_PPase/PF02358_16/1_3e03Trehalose_PPase/PF02358_16/2_4e29Glycos_transf_1/PF00534_20/8_8e03Glycos_transf_1/PF00534_20/0_0013_NODE_82_length_14933_cov_91_583546_g73_i038257391
MRGKRSGVASTPLLNDADVPRHLIGQLTTEWTKVVREGPNSQRLLQDEIEKLRLKWSRLRAAGDEKVAETPVDASLPSQPGTLYVVFRRLPLLIRYSNRKEGQKSNPDEMCIWESVKGDASGVWKLVYNKFNINYSESLAEHLGNATKVVVVGDPGVDVSRITDDAAEQRRLTDRLNFFLKANSIVPVWLSHEARKERYSEELLYPLFHYRTPPIGTGFSYLDWPAYVECNETFAKAICAVCQATDWILVFNYHLMLVPQVLRREEIGKELIIHFYLPTVFPSSEMYRILPQREELLKGVLCSNVISFHSHQYRTHFMAAVTRVLGVECTPHSVEPCVESGGTGVRVCVTPLGVEIKAWETAASALDINSLQERFQGRKIILGVDTLDYTKGLPQKMTAFRKFLNSHPSWATKVVFIQLCFIGRRPSVDAGHASSYRLSSLDRKEILTQVFQVSGHINSSLGTVDHLPVHFLVGTFSVQELIPVFAMADVGLMTALRESISTALYQFVLCQRFTNKGVLILSEFSGSAQLLGAACLQVNPWNINAVSTAIADALTMPEEERNERHKLAYQIITKHDPSAWARQVISDCSEAILERDDDKVEVPPPLQITRAVAELTTAKHIFIITGIKETLLSTPAAMVDTEAIHPRAKQTDYDNEPEDDCSMSNDPLPVETPPTQEPQITSPTSLTMTRSLEQDLNSLANSPSCSVLIVSSSSVPAVETVLHNCPNVYAFAENGHYYRAPGDQEFLPFTHVLEQDQDIGHSVSVSESGQSRIVSQDEEQQADEVLEECLAKVQELIDYFAKRTPGSFMRKTLTSISWHYGNADKTFASNQARDLLFHLWAGPLMNSSLLELCVGKTSVEIRSCKQTKAQVVEWCIKDILAKNNLSMNEVGILCIGNYLPRDEEIYAVLNRLMRNPRRSRTSTSDMRSPSGGTASLPLDERHLPRCFTCTAGVRFSKAAYRLDTKNLIGHLLRRLNEALVSREYPAMQVMSPGSMTPSHQFVQTEPRAVPASPSVDVALAMASPDYTSRRPADYYRYLPTGLDRGFSPAPLPSQEGQTNRLIRRPSLKHPDGSDVEDEDAEDDEEMFVLGAGQALNVANGIPFTHARSAWTAAATRPASVSPRWMTGHATEHGTEHGTEHPRQPREDDEMSNFATPFSTLPHTRATSAAQQNRQPATPAETPQQVSKQ